MKVGDEIQWWAGKEHGWVGAKILSISTLGYPTVFCPVTKKRKQLRWVKRTID